MATRIEGEQLMGGKEDAGNNALRLALPYKYLSMIIIIRLAAEKVSLLPRRNGAHCVRRYRNNGIRVSTFKCHCHAKSKAVIKLHYTLRAATYCTRLNSPINS